MLEAFEARVDDWTNDAFIYCGPDWGDDRGDEVVDWRASMECVSREDDDHCFRDMYRGQLEALEANSSYYEIQAVSPTGASFVKPTLVRASLESAY